MYYMKKMLLVVMKMKEMMNMKRMKLVLLQEMKVLVVALILRKKRMELKEVLVL